MTAIAQRITIYFFAAIFLLAAALTAYFQEYYLLLIPFAILISAYLIQNPQYLFYLLLASIPWSVEFHFTPNLGTDLPDEPLMLLTALAACLLAIFQYKKLQKQNIHPLLAVLFLQLAWILITIVTSTDFILSVKYFLAKCWYMLAFAGMPLFLFTDKKLMKRSIVILLCSMLACMFVSLTREARMGWAFEKINDALHPFFHNHVIYSALLVFMVPLQVAAIKLSSSKKIKFVLGSILVITIGALYFSYARGAWLALLTATITYWLLRKKLLVVAFLLFFSLCIASAFWLKSNDRYLKFSNDFNTTIFHASFSEHLLATYQLKDVSNAERFYRWIAGVRMINDSWRTGFGPNTFYENYRSYTIPAFKTWVSNNKEHSTVHNYFLFLIVEQGIMGLLLFLVLVSSMFWYVQKIYHRTKDKFWKITVGAVAAILMMECTVNFLSDMIETDKIGSIFYLCLATIIIADVKTKKETIVLFKY